MLPETVVRPRKLVIEDEIIIIVNIVFNLKERDFMEKRLSMFFACLFLSIGMALAQTKVTGTVVSSEDNEPVIGASVKVVGTKTGVATDIDGKFSLVVNSKNAELEFSSIGMVTKRLKASANMMVVLDPSRVFVGKPEPFFVFL